MLVSIAAAAILLAGCSSAAPDVDPAPSSDMTPDAQPSPSSSPTAAVAQGPAGLKLAEWAVPFTGTGPTIATISGADFQLEVQQIGTQKATSTGSFAYPDGTPVIKEGDDLVFLNYVVTNTSQADIPLGYSLVTVDARYDDWSYLQGMDGLADDDLFDALGLSQDGASYEFDVPYVLHPGESFAYAENFAYEPGEAISFDVDLTPVDSTGDLDHDKAEDVTGTGTVS